MNNEEDLPYNDELEQDFDAPNKLVSVAICYDLEEAEKIKKFLEIEGFQVVATTYDELQIDDLASHIEKGINLNVFQADSYDAVMRLDPFREKIFLAGEITTDNGWGNCPECQSKNLSIVEDVAVEMTLLTYLKTFFRADRNLHCNDCAFEWITEKE